MAFQPYGLPALDPPALLVTSFHLRPCKISVLRPSSPHHRQRDLLTVPLTPKATIISVARMVPLAQKARDHLPNLEASP
jgi:hypothetical protein